MRIIFTVLLVLLISTAPAVSKEMKKKHSFDSSSKYGLVLFETELGFGFKDFDHQFLEYSEEKKRPFKGGKKYELDKTGWMKNLKGKIPILARFEPGTYVLHYSTAQSGLTIYRGCFHNGTIKFTVEPGKITYIGGIRLAGPILRPTPHNEEGARAFLAQFPKVSAELVLQTPKAVRYEAPTYTLIKGKCPGTYPE